jgi:hypothetical protein
MIGLRFVQDHQAEFPVNKMCALVGVPRSSFYEWATRKARVVFAVDSSLAWST